MEIIRSELVELTSQYVRNVEEKMNNLILNVDEKEKLMELRYEQKLKVGGSKLTWIIKQFTPCILPQQYE